MTAQFFSSLADNALLVAAIHLLQSSQAPAWQVPALAPMFALFYVLLAPWVGAFADTIPKGRVMFISNAIKVVGCMLMLFGGHPLLAYAVVGLGAAAYSPAKYGILTELLPPSQLVRANGWIEGLTIASVLLGMGLGGFLIKEGIAAHLLALDLPLIDTHVDTAAEAAIAFIGILYGVAAAVNLKVPNTGVAMQPMPSHPLKLVAEFSQCNMALWRDRLGQISLAVTTLFWGASANMRVIVFAWAAAALGYGTAKATGLAIVVVIGTAAGAVVAALRVRLDQAVTLIPLGIWMGLLLVALNLMTHIWLAVPFLVVMGAVGGYLLVPMNALLQHRGSRLMGAGRSIAVQNFNEQACILLLGAFYTGLTKLNLSAFAAIAVLGFLIAGCMWWIKRWYARNLREDGPEVQRLLEIARTDPH